MTRVDESAKVICVSVLGRSVFQSCLLVVLVPDGRLGCSDGLDDAKFAYKMQAPQPQQWPKRDRIPSLL